MPADEEPRTLENVVANHDMVAAWPAFSYDSVSPAATIWYQKWRR